jgi:cytochrome o ubiquinol oxidase operon protein cyoD
MSAHDSTTHDDHGHDGHVSHSTFKGYATGFILAVILTIIPFWLVMAKVFDKSSTTGLVLLGIGAVQIVVHMFYFLHMNTKSEHGWSMLALIFTVMLVVIMMSGSLWVMYHLNHNMMPGMMDTTIETKPESINATSASTALGVPQNADGSKPMP